MCAVERREQQGALCGWVGGFKAHSLSHFGLVEGIPTLVLQQQPRVWSDSASIHSIAPHAVVFRCCSGCTNAPPTVLHIVCLAKHSLACVFMPNTRCHPTRTPQSMLLFGMCFPFLWVVGSMLPLCYPGPRVRCVMTRDDP